MISVDEHFFVVLGINHHSASIEIREKLALNANKVSEVLRNFHRAIYENFSGILQLPSAWNDSGSTELNSSKRVNRFGCVIVSTCNRLEVYLVFSTSGFFSETLLQKKSHIERIREILLNVLINSISHQFLEAFEPKYWFTVSGERAVEHLFRVTAGLDSMVLGETQIKRQITKSFALAVEVGVVNKFLQILFQFSFGVAKFIRTNTQFGRQVVTFSGAAVFLAKRVFGELENERVLLIGAGEMIELTCVHFQAQSPQSITISNRTYQTAKKIAERRRLQLLDFDQISQNLGNFDVIVSCTASTLPLITYSQMKLSQSKRNSKPVVLIDLAVPRDIEGRVSDLPNTYLYTIDDLGAMASQGVSRRMSEADKAEALLKERVNLFFNNFVSDTEKNKIIKIKQEIDFFTQEELRKAHHKIESGESVFAVMDALTNALSRRYTDRMIAISKCRVSVSESREKVIDELTLMQNRRQYFLQ